MPFLELPPISTAVVAAGWQDPTNAYAFDNSYAYSETSTAEQSYDYQAALTGSEVIDKVFARIKYIPKLTGVLTGDDATLTFTLKVYDGSTWTNFQVAKLVYAVTTASDESLTVTVGDNSNSSVSVDVTSVLSTLAKLNSAQTALLTTITADAGLTVRVSVDCVSLLVLYHTVGDVFVGKHASTRRDLEAAPYKAIRKVAQALS